MKPKIADVAKAAGVSPTTVSRVLNNRGYISEKTRKKVHSAMEELNYHPNDLARSLYTKKTNLIGVVFPTTSNPFYGELIYNLELQASSRGYKVLLCNSQGDEQKEKEYVKMLRRNQVDGIIAGAHNKGIKDYNIPGLPVVGIDRYLSSNIPVVSSDNYKGGKIATELLIKLGCKNIIHINGPRSLDTPANLRRDAYEEVMKSNHLKPVTYELEIFGDNKIAQENNYKSITQRIFDENRLVDGIFASDDLIASQVLKEAKKRNIKVPESLKVIGYDGAEMTRLLLPELTTIQQPIIKIAHKAIEILIKQIEGNREKVSFETTFDVELIESETT